MIKAITRLSNTFDGFCKKKLLEKVEHYVVNIALLVFLVHLLLIYLIRTVPGFESLADYFSTNYLAAIATPFTVILLFEIFLLILTIPQSITRSIGRQYEIISLIIIRDVFHAFGEIENLSSFVYEPKVIETIGIDMLGGALMFLLVTAFYHLQNKRIKKSSKVVMGRFIALKKASAVVLTFVLLGLLSWYAINAIGGFIGSEGMQAFYNFSWQQNFFIDFFTIMVFIDVFILIFSYRYTADYEVFWRNSGFVISTILMRFSLTLDKPFDIFVAIASILFGIGTLFIYIYFRKIHTWKEVTD
ncbi:MAG: hypothetical protein ACPGO5_03935 [Patescibacteria group bacterium]